MNFNRPLREVLKISLFSGTLACIVVLTFHIHFKTPCVTENSKQTKTVYNSYYPDISDDSGSSTLLPVMDFKELESKRKLLLLIIVSTAPRRFKRRQAIRDTWWKHCIGSQVKCVFVTDGFIEDSAERDFVVQERSHYNDMELQPLQGGREFGLRFLNQIKWAMAKFDFQYILRIDDDYFLCLKTLLSEIQVRPKENLVWGNFHCEANVAWVDESFMIFTQDIIVKFLSQNESTMLCHPHAGQQIGLWLNDIPTKLFKHDSRLYHGKPASFSSKFDNIKNVCDSYLGVHGTYEEKMRYFGQNSNDKNRSKAHRLPDFSTFCKTTTFDYRVIHPPFYYEPKLCKDNPRWVLERGMYVGRQNGQ